jgi:hypothetical protein
MNRTHWLLAIILLLGTATAAHHWWRSRGLITIHSEDWPMSKIVRTIERQGGIRLATNVPAETPVRLHVEKVPVAEALETLATVVEGRWQLSYVMAPSLIQTNAAIASLATGERPEDWKRYFYPMPNFAEEEGGPLPDPRTDVWTVKAADPADLHTYAEQAARTVNAALVAPAGWNPAIPKPPSGGAIRKAAPALAKAGGGRVVEVFLVEKRERRGEGEGGERGPRREDREEGPPPFARDGDSDSDRQRRRQIMEERALAEIQKLPEERRAAALAQFEERRKFFESLRDLPPEQRREKMEEMFQRDDMQERLEQRMSERMARMTPDQRVERGERYQQRKQEIRSGQ